MIPSVRMQVSCVPTVALFKETLNAALQGKLRSLVVNEKLVEVAFAHVARSLHVEHDLLRDLVNMF